MIHIYCGDGKGKTTAAFGLAVRASGADYNVIIAQFLKSRKVSELNTLQKLDNVTVLRADLEDVFSYQMDDGQKSSTLSLHNDLFKRAICLCGDEHNLRTLLIFDEIIGALSEGLIDSDAVMNFLRENRSAKNLEIVLTGRDPTEELVELGDYVTEMKKIKHPYDNGVNMRKGIEY